MALKKSAEFRAIPPGEYLKEEFLRPNGLTIQEAADAIRVTRQTLQVITRLKDPGAVTPQMALRLEQLTEWPAEMWLKLQAEYALQVTRQERPGFVSIKPIREILKAKMPRAILEADKAALVKVGKLTVQGRSQNKQTKSLERFTLDAKKKGKAKKPTTKNMGAA